MYSKPKVLLKALVFSLLVCAFECAPNSANPLGGITEITLEKQPFGSIDAQHKDENYGLDSQKLHQEENLGDYQLKQASQDEEFTNLSDNEMKCLFENFDYSKAAETAIHPSESKILPLDHSPSASQSQHPGPYSLTEGKAPSEFPNDHNSQFNQQVLVNMEIQIDQSRTNTEPAREFNQELGFQKQQEQNKQTTLIQQQRVHAKFEEENNKIEEFSADDYEREALLSGATEDKFFQVQGNSQQPPKNRVEVPLFTEQKTESNGHFKFIQDPNLFQRIMHELAVVSNQDFSCIGTTSAFDDNHIFNNDITEDESDEDDQVCRLARYILAFPGLKEVVLGYVNAFEKQIIKVSQTVQQSQHDIIDTYSFFDFGAQPGHEQQKCHSQEQEIQIDYLNLSKSTQQGLKEIVVQDDGESEAGKGVNSEDLGSKMHKTESQSQKISEKQVNKLKNQLQSGKFIQNQSNTSENLSEQHKMILNQSSVYPSPQRLNLSNRHSGSSISTTLLKAILMNQTDLVSEPQQILTLSLVGIIVFTIIIAVPLGIYFYRKYLILKRKNAELQELQKQQLQQYQQQQQQAQAQSNIIINIHVNKDGGIELPESETEVIRNLLDRCYSQKQQSLVIDKQTKSDFSQQQKVILIKNTASGEVSQQDFNTNTKAHCQIIMVQSLNEDLKKHESADSNSKRSSLVASLSDEDLKLDNQNDEEEDDLESMSSQNFKSTRSENNEEEEEQKQYVLPLRDDKIHVKLKYNQNFMSCLGPKDINIESLESPLTIRQRQCSFECTPTKLMVHSQNEREQCQTARQRTAFYTPNKYTVEGSPQSLQKAKSQHHPKQQIYNNAGLVYHDQLKSDKSYYNSLGTQLENLEEYEEENHFANTTMEQKQNHILIQDEYIIDNEIQTTDEIREEEQAAEDEEVKENQSSSVDKIVVDLQCKKNLFSQFKITPQIGNSNGKVVPSLDLQKVAFSETVNDYADYGTGPSQMPNVGMFPIMRRYAACTSSQIQQQQQQYYIKNSFVSERNNLIRNRQYSLQKTHENKNPAQAEFRLPESSYQQTRQILNHQATMNKSQALSQGRTFFKQNTAAISQRTQSPYIQQAQPQNFNLMNAQQQNAVKLYPQIFSPQFGPQSNNLRGYMAKSFYNEDYNYGLINHKFENQTNYQRNVRLVSQRDSQQSFLSNEIHDFHCEENNNNFHQEHISLQESYYLDQMSQGSLHKFSNSSFHNMNFMRSPPQATIHNISVNPQIFRNQQSASPKVQKIDLNKIQRIIPHQTEFSQADTFSQGIESKAQVQFGGQQTLQESIIEPPNCMVYLENGRYKNSFEVIEFLGKGGFGICHKVQHKLDSNFYAVKKIRMHLAYNQDIKEHKVYREIMALPMLNHKNVVRYFGCWAESIEMSEEIKIQRRVQTIMKRLQRPNKINKDIKKLRNNTVKQFEESPSSANEEIMVLNELNIDQQLDDALDQQRAKSYLSNSESPNKKKTRNSNSDYSSSVEDEQNDSELGSFEDSEDEDDDKSENELSSQDNDQEDDDASQSENDYDSENEEVSELNDDIFESSEGSEDDDSEQRGIFDDDALIEFVKKNEKFVSIDLMIQMEYCSGSSLQTLLEEPGRVIDRQKNFQFFKQLLSAIKHIHQNGFIHRDLKPANVFIEGQLLKVGDFGLARRFKKVLSHLPLKDQISSPKGFKQLMSKQKSIPKLISSMSQGSLLTNQVGTSTYLSPEQEQNKAYNEKVDIFALGLILCELYSKFSTYHEKISTINDLKYKGKLPEAMQKEYPLECQIIILMVNQEPDLRPSAENLLKHHLFQQWEKQVFPNLISPREPINAPLQELSLNNHLGIMTPNTDFCDDKLQSLKAITEEGQQSMTITNSNINLDAPNPDSPNDSFKLDANHLESNDENKNCDNSQLLNPLSLKQSMQQRSRMIKVSSMYVKNPKQLQLELLSTLKEEA